jgi:uncharacterized membrane protein YgdD (TMEM256/DUF423 family)
MKVAAILGATGVGLGAFGAHGLRTIVEDPHLLEVWETGARYHLIHAVATLALGRGHIGTKRLWVLGVLLFSGSLYAMTLTGARWLGAVTPLGGVAFILGWLLLLRRS